MRVLVVAGASGGHIFPAEAFLEKLREKYPSSESLLVLPSRSIALDLSFPKQRVAYLPSYRLSFSFSKKNIKGLLSFVRAAWQGLFILLRFKPDIVLGFGSLDSLPLVITAWFFRIKTLIHEQNVLPGKANRFLAKFSDGVAISFLESKRHFGLREDKIFFSGNPIRGSLKKEPKEEALRSFGLEEGRLTILVMGGSQGSSRVNELFLKAVELIEDKKGFQVLHILGRDGLLKDVQDRYKSLGVSAKVFLFSKEMGRVYSCADLAVSRAGATTISELIYFKVPAIFLPYPFAYRHQFYNALALEGIGAGIIIKDEEASLGALHKAIEGLVANPVGLTKMRDNFKHIFQGNAVERLLEVAESLLYRD
ncbi:MAG: undecaprenyldiphospho-muramoylpentapeptide beta-N-acetylglucosaminyltransferase [Candidatus Omnitrophota bacterium]